MKLDKLKEVELRDVWKHEQYGFSDWLSKEENINALSEVVGLTLVDVEKESYVGSYRCDLVAIDENTNDKVIIENQLEQSNHDHLGKVITYASGLGATTIIWIVKTAREEHRSAIEWLNNNMKSGIDFFLIEIKLYSIGNSLPAPKFEIVEKPNEFIKSSKKYSQVGNLNKSQSERVNFWEEFNNLVIEKKKPFNTRKVTPDHWYSVAIGTSKASIIITLVNQSGYIGVQLAISDNKELFDDLVLQRDEIETDLSFDLEWNRLDNNKVSRIISKIEGLNFDDKSNYDELMEETIRRVIKMRDVFKKKL